MPRTHKSPGSLRLSTKDKAVATQAARIERKRLKDRRIGWSTIIAKGGMSLARRIVRRAEKEKASAA